MICLAELQVDSPIHATPEVLIIKVRPLFQVIAGSPTQRLANLVRMRKWSQSSVSTVTVSSMAFKLAANLSFLFKEKSFLERFDAAAACGEK